MKSQRGAAVVEFAFVLPLLLVIIFGIIEFSVLLYDKAIITNASREGARAGIVFATPRLTSAQIEALVKERIYKDPNDPTKGYVLISFDNALPTVTAVTSGTGVSGDTLTVTINYNFNFLVFSNVIKLIGGNFRDGIPLSAVTIMRLE